MKSFRYLGKFTELFKSTKDRQRDINVSEVFHLWNHLVQRYSVINVTNTLEFFVKDDDLRAILKIGRNTLTNNVKVLEQEMMLYGIPLPTRPPKQITTTAAIEQISDRYAYRRVLRGIQAFLPTHTMAFIHSTSPKIRDLFMTILVEELKIYDKFLEYGKLKEYLIQPPVYRI